MSLMVRSCSVKLWFSVAVESGHSLQIMQFCLFLCVPFKKMNTFNGKQA